MIVGESVKRPSLGYAIVPSDLGYGWVIEVGVWGGIHLKLNGVPLERQGVCNGMCLQDVGVCDGDENYADYLRIGCSEGNLGRNMGYNGYLQIWLKFSGM